MAHPSATSRAVTPELFAGALTENTATAMERLGRVRMEYDTTTESFQKYIYVKNNSNAAFADGNVGYANMTDFTAVTKTSTNALNKPVGVAFSTITASYYGWLQCYGYHDAVLTDGGDDIDPGDLLLGSGTAGVVHAGEAGTTMIYKTIGVCVTADNTTSVAAMITLNPL